MCIKVVERYAVCRCIYYSHAVDTCPAYGRRGHSIKTIEVLVGYTCSSSWHTGNTGLHDREEIIKVADKLSASSEVSPAGGSTVPSTVKAATNVEALADSSLHGRLMAKFQKVLETDEQFVPASDLDEVLTGHAIKEELQSFGLEDPSSFVFLRARKIFAILLMIRKLDALQCLIEEELGDELLPVSNSAIMLLEDNKLRPVFSKWDVDTRKQFFELQWTLLAPVFSDGKHLKLDDDAKLPFIKTEPIANRAYGGVHCVEIHRDHDSFEKLGSPLSQNVSPRPPKGLLIANTDAEQGHVYALKQFKLGTADVNQRAFHRELAVMKSTSSSGHGHIIKLLATFEQGGRYSMIFPLAEENLRQFWAHENPSSVNHLWYFEQMAGLANAISHIHNHLLVQDSRPMLGYHMDIKPENILIVRDSDWNSSRWLLSDFGSSYFHPKDSIRELPPHPGHGTYEPPECQLDLPQSRAYDMWSFGCVMTECLIFLMKGSDALNAFAEDRFTDVEVSGNIFRDDYFFTLELNEASEPVGAMTRPAVIQWIRDLERDPKCTEAVAALLNLVKDGLLQVDQYKRLNAISLSQSIKLIHQSAKEFFESEAKCLGICEARVTEVED
ncbi:hypothetical protein IMSHALPRED_005947 [Imshaugia aleurites]|uniref:Protein kinase domain-containing protein n=1 Tax=Imshaugia aleurites TaxID=172621 RepID=A0A8H3ICZ9_9LECA|nr:hypothetical protein IMSHALPRED_005947 [Imshaugia aleurites]